jgi:phosphate transport system ATP-binding protein
MTPEENVSVAEPPTTDQLTTGTPPATETAGAAPLAIRMQVTAEATETVTHNEVRIAVKNLNIYYGPKRAVTDVTMDIPANAVTAFIGPSGCGKSTILRCFDRMNDLIANARIEGEVVLNGENIYGPGVLPVEVRRRVGLVFQRPNPFPMTIYDNVAYGPRRHGQGDKKLLDEIVERSLKRAALWDEVKDDYKKKSGLALSGGQQQRLCIARTMATEPDVILMDEPASALDPISTLKIEDLIHELRQRYTIVIVTHNMQQASRVSQMTAFFTLGEDRAGYLVEFSPTAEIFTNPKQQLTEDYVSGRFG